MGSTFSSAFEDIHIEHQAMRSTLSSAFNTIYIHLCIQGWSGGAMVLGKLPVPGRPTILITVRRGRLRLQ